MYIYAINDKAEIRAYLCNGINPRKTLRFNMFGSLVSVILTYDEELEEVYLIRCAGIRAYYYDFNEAVSELERIFDVLYQLDMDEHMDCDDEMQAAPVYAYGI